MYCMWQPAETSTDVCSLSLFTCFMISSCHNLVQNLLNGQDADAGVDKGTGFVCFFDRLWLNSATCLNHRCGEEQGATT